MWVGVTPRFRRLNEALGLTDDQLQDGNTKQTGVRQCLQRAYYGEASEHPPGFLVGSWGRGTAIRPPQDIDIFFPLPFHVYGRINDNAGNVQSALLAEVRGHLLRTYPQSAIRGDGQVVIVGFNSVAIEVVPVFLYDENRRYVMPDTNAGGRWKIVAPLAELHLLEAADASSGGNARVMARMLKVWKRECNVPLNSYLVEMLATEFIASYEYRERDWYYFDWFMRDFFSWLCLQGCRNMIIPGTGELVNLGSDWLSRAETARGRALTACDYERNDFTTLAGEEWQKIFGHRIPIHVI